MEVGVALNSLAASSVDDGEGMAAKRTLQGRLPWRVTHSRSACLPPPIAVPALSPKPLTRAPPRCAANGALLAATTALSLYSLHKGDLDKKKKIVVPAVVAGAGLAGLNLFLSSKCSK
mmetsp:Transcript_2306/g.8118  ORF Transcript_2306/g.8118 Transcript_2306/m.8118 type:complete len:118 (-) Transcript_2306:264-617(-)